MRNGVRIVVYRTAVDGTVARRLTSVDNDETDYKDYVAIGDIMPDVSIAANEALYITGGVLESVAPQSHRIQCFHQGRHFIVDREVEATDIYYSKQRIQDFAMEESDSLLMQIPPDGGDIMAIRSFMDKLVVFKNDCIYVVVGSGPDATGSDSGYYDPYRLATNIGCIARDTVVETPYGLMFFSRQGIMLLDTSLEISSVGEKVRYHTDSHTPIAGVAMPYDNMAAWFSPDGYALMWNWRHSQWTTHDISATSACYAGGDLWTKNGNYVWRRVDNTALEPTSATYSMILDTGWISLAGIGGFQRVCSVLVVGQKLLDHSLVFEIGYDYDGYYSDVQTIDTSSIEPYPASVYFGDGSSVFDGQSYVYKVVTRRQKCTSFRVRIHDTATRGSTWAVSAIAVEAASKKGLYKYAKD
jgi:hypothetical protein